MIHPGHIKSLQASKKMGDILVVIVNNDEQVKIKGSLAFMPEKERLEIIKAIGYSQKLFNKANENVRWYHIWWLAVIVGILLNFIFPHIVFKIVLFLIAFFPFMPWARKILKKLGVKNID